MPKKESADQGYDYPHADHLAKDQTAIIQVSRHFRGLTIKVTGDRGPGKAPPAGVG
jgi:hypothetical protein